MDVNLTHANAEILYIEFLCMKRKRAENEANEANEVL
jgi:hypothetical protein